MTTFETLNHTKASLEITEYYKENEFTKSIAIIFDEKNEFRIKSYRAIEINKINNNNKIKIEKLN